MDDRKHHGGGACLGDHPLLRMAALRASMLAPGPRLLALPHVCHQGEPALPAGAGEDQRGVQGRRAHQPLQWRECRRRGGAGGEDQSHLAGPQQREARASDPTALAAASANSLPPPRSCVDRNLLRVVRPCHLDPDHAQGEERGAVLGRGVDQKLLVSDGRHGGALESPRKHLQSRAGGCCWTQHSPISQHVSLRSQCHRRLVVIRRRQHRHLLLRLQRRQRRRLEHSRHLIDRDVSYRSSRGRNGALEFPRPHLSSCCPAAVQHSLLR
mmetsp:Transcript_11872/g.27396  ORF Transcript_11872/g.27396 Transcript_11872/m.27396 type:complete len:269 (-) Transcript_11872:127-933(-)